MEEEKGKESKHDIRWWDGFQNYPAKFSMCVQTGEGVEFWVQVDTGGKEKLCHQIEGTGAAPGWLSH